MDYVAEDDTDPETAECSAVWNIAPKDRCEWILKNADCDMGGVIIHYIFLMFCIIGSENMTYFYLVFSGLILWLLYLFLILGSTADNFFCPSISVIGAVLHLSDNIAGVTILAFGNGSPDIFTSLVTRPEERLTVFSEIIGSGVFVTTLIIGAITIVSPFTVQAKYFLRDVFFYFIGICWISWIITDAEIYAWEAFTGIGIYVAYIIVVITMQHFETSGDNYRKRVPKFQDPDVLRAFVANRDISDLNAPPKLPKRSNAFGVHANLDVAMHREYLREYAIGDDTQLPVPLDENFDLRETNPSRLPAPPQPVSSTRPRGLLKEFFYDINPINPTDWNEADWKFRILLIIRAPFMLPLQLIIPVVNETAEKRGWSKLLNCLQICYTPVVCACILELFSQRVGPLPLIGFIAIVSCSIGFLLFICTSKNKIPFFHNAFAFLGFITAMLIVFAVAREVMGVLTIVGLVSGISGNMLGITLLAWGNSISDAISNVTIARKGFPRMGFSACFGGPMFNTLIGLGLTYGIAAYVSENSRAHVRTGFLTPGCIAFLLLSLICSFVYLSITGFAARKSYGYMLFSLYAIFLLINLLSELKVILSLGFDYRPDSEEFMYFYEYEYPEYEDSDYDYEF